MLTTVTTTTTTAVAAGLAAPLGAIAVVTLLALLIQREIFVSCGGGRGKVIGQSMSVVIVPLFLAFLLVAVEALLDVLR